MASRRQRDRRWAMVIAGAGAVAGTLVATAQPVYPGGSAAVLIVGLVGALVVVAALSWLRDQLRRLHLPSWLKLLR